MKTLGSYNIVKDALIASKMYNGNLSSAFDNNLYVLCGLLDNMALTLDCLGKDVKASVDEDRRILTIILDSFTITLYKGGECANMFNKIVGIAESFTFKNSQAGVLTTSFKFSLDKLEKSF